MPSRGATRLPSQGATRLLQPCGLDQSLGGLLGDLPSTDPQLSPLGLFVSETPSYHPLPGSPVIDRLFACAAPGDDDQDGFERPDGDVTGDGSCDLGSIEVLACDTALDDEVPPGVYGSGTWVACHNLSANAVEVSAGGTVTATARYSISFGNGFEVGSLATFTAELDRTAGWGALRRYLSGAPGLSGVPSPDPHSFLVRAAGTGSLRPPRRHQLPSPHSTSIHALEATIRERPSKVRSAVMGGAASKANEANQRSLEHR